MTFNDEGEVVEETKSEPQTCPGCEQSLPSEDELAKHMVSCMRKTTTCKICKETFHQTKKKEHLLGWRDARRIKYFLENDEDDNLKFSYAHGSKMEAVLDKTTKETALHYIAQFNSLKCFLVMLGNGVENLEL
jgi:hypothetical protein